MSGTNGYRPWRIAAAMVILGVFVAQQAASIVNRGYAPSETTLVIQFTALTALIAAETLDVWRKR